VEVVGVTGELDTGGGDGSMSIGVGSKGLDEIVGGTRGTLHGGGSVGRGGGVEVIGIGVIIGATTVIVGAMREEAMALDGGTETFTNADDTAETGAGVDKVWACEGDATICVEADVVDGTEGGGIGTETGTTACVVGGGVGTTDDEGEVAIGVVGGWDVVVTDSGTEVGTGGVDGVTTTTELVGALDTGNGG